MSGTAMEPLQSKAPSPNASSHPEELSHVSSPALGHQQGSRPTIKVTVGTSRLATQDFCERVARMVNEAYQYNRLSAPEVAQRLCMGDPGPDANRVLHLAWRVEAGAAEETLVGCCSSTRQTPWCPRGCGHWGLLVVDVEAQGTGVASALVSAAESRLSGMGLKHVQIEYEYTRGDAACERLYAWYEGTLGFDGGGSPGYHEFRRCRKLLSRPETVEDDSGGNSVLGSRKTGEDGLGSDCSKAGSISHVQSVSRCWASLLRFLRKAIGSA